MTKLLLAGAAASALLAAPAVAQDARIASWYSQAGLGLSLPTDDGAFIGTVEGEVDYDPGFAFGGLVGYQFGNLAVEGEVTGRANDFDDNVSDENLTVTAFLVNGVLSGAADALWQPYAGAGAGYATSNIEGADGSFAWQAKAGLRRNLGPSGAVGVEASYLSTNGFEDRDFGIDYGAASFIATYTFRFGPY